MLTPLLDTNIVIEIIKRKPRQALAALNAHAGWLAISALTITGLLHGAQRRACR